MNTICRCWNVEEKIMHDVAFPSWNGIIEVWKNNIPQSEIQYLSINGPEEHGILEHFTNFIDNKKNDVFEGDTVDLKFNDYYSNPCCTFEDGDVSNGKVVFQNGGWFIETFCGGLIYLFDLQNEDICIYVTGNIHEKP